MTKWLAVLIFFIPSNENSEMIVVSFMFDFEDKPGLCTH